MGREGKKGERGESQERGKLYRLRADEKGEREGAREGKGREGKKGERGDSHEVSCREQGRERKRRMGRSKARRGER